MSDVGKRPLWARVVCAFVAGALVFSTSGCGEVQKAIDEITGQKTFQERLTDENSLAEQTVNTAVALRAAVDAAENALNSGNYDAYNTAWENTIPQLAANLEDSASALHGAEQELISEIRSASRSAGRSDQWIILIVGAVLAIGSLVVTAREVDNTIKKAQGDTESWITQRMKYYKNKGMSDSEARLFAQADSSKVRVRNGVEAGGKVLETIMTEAAENVILPKPVGAVKDAYDITTHVVGSNGQCDTDPSDDRKAGVNELSGANCRIYVGVSSNGRFGNVPTGTWDFAVFHGGNARNSLQGITVTSGATTTIGHSLISTGSATEANVAENDNTGSSGGGSTDNDPLPWSYGGTGSLTCSITANYGVGGSVSCAVPQSYAVTLNADSSLTGSINGGCVYSFDEQGNGLSCAADGSRTGTLSGSHANGSYTMTSSGSLNVSGSYNASSLSGATSSTQSVTLTNGAPVTAALTWSFTLSRN